MSNELIADDFNTRPTLGRKSFLQFFHKDIQNSAIFFCQVKSVFLQPIDSCEKFTRAERVLYLFPENDTPSQRIADVIDVVQHLRSEKTRVLPVPKELQMAPENMNIQIRLVTSGALSAPCPKDCYNWATQGLPVNPLANSQIRIKTEEHSCEGQSSWESPSCQSAWQTNISAVFLGLATDGREEDVPIILDEENKHTLRLQVTFQVNESFVGVSEKVVTVTSGGDLCGYPFSKGHKYLVYGRRLPSGEVYVSIFSSTKWAKDAADDLKYLRGLPTAPHGATIHGTVFRYTRPENPRIMAIRRAIPEVGHKVEIHGTSQDYETTVDSHGNFKLSGLPPGRYTVLLNADGEIHISPPLKSTTVDVADKGCARFGFWIDPFVKKESKNLDGQQTPPTHNPEAEDHR